MLTVAFDTETLGTDFNFGAKPFMVTACTSENRRPVFWEWDVDPLTRTPIVPSEDVQRIRHYMDKADILVFQNAKFDIAAFRTVGIINEEYPFPWHKLRDTLIAAHMLASNQPKGLDELAVQYLRVDIRPVEKILETHVKQAQNKVRRGSGNGGLFAGWAISSKDRADMPSAKEKTWKFDYWLPRAVAIRERQASLFPDDPIHTRNPALTCLSEYGCLDSAITLDLWAGNRVFRGMERELKARDLWEIFLERMKLVRIAYEMEMRGITVSKDRLYSLRDRFKEDSNRLSALMVGIAQTYGYSLQLPKTTLNKSLTTFIFDVMKCPILDWTDNGNPKLDKEVVAKYVDGELPEKSKPRLFIKTLADKRQRDKVIGDIETYRRFWIPIHDKRDRMRLESFCGNPRCKAMITAGVCPVCYWEDPSEWRVMFPNVNPTGSDTLRWSHKNPNEANTSKKSIAEGFPSIRQAFGPRPGRIWVKADAENLELRIPSFEAQEPDAMEVFLHPERPPYFGSYHLVIADLLHPELFAEWGKGFKKEFESTWYQWIKNGNFGLIYGAQETKTDKTYRVPGAYQKVRNRFPRIAKLSDHYIRFANRNGYVETIPDKLVNPRRGYPLLCTRSEEQGVVLPTVPLNYHIQSTAMQWTNSTMIVTTEYLDSINRKMRLPEGEGFYLIAQVHDEDVFEFPTPNPSTVSPQNPLGEYLPIAHELKRLMEACGERISVPTPVSVEICVSSWSEGIPLPPLSVMSESSIEGRIHPSPSETAA